MVALLVLGARWIWAEIARSRAQGVKETLEARVQELSLRPPPVPLTLQIQGTDARVVELEPAPRPSEPEPERA